MSVKVASELTRARVRLNLTELNPTKRGGRIKPDRIKPDRIKRDRIKATPLIFEPGHKNIGTLIAFLLTIFLGIGAGWLAGSVLSGASEPTPVAEAQVVTQTEQTAPVNPIDVKPIDNADQVKQAETEQPLVEQQSNKDEPRAHSRRRAGSRRVYVTAQAGESVPLAVIKGKPIKKAFKQFKRMRIW